MVIEDFLLQDLNYVPASLKTYLFHQAFLNLSIDFYLFFILIYVVVRFFRVLIHFCKAPRAVNYIDAI